MTGRRGRLRLVSPSRRPMAEVGDEELLGLCAAGNDEAVSMFVARFQADVVRFISHMLGRHDGAIEDLAQLTFLGALGAAERFDGRSSVRTWLLGIAHNKVRVEIRSRSRRRNAMRLFTSLSLVRRNAQDPDVETAELRRRIEQALMELDAKRRAVFVLCEVEGLSGRQAARVLQVPEGTVRRRLLEARRRLRPLLNDDDSRGTS